MTPSDPKLSGLPQIFAVVADILVPAGIDCLLIGGWAVNHYGYTRNTLDVDFMVVSEQRDTVWTILKRDLHPLALQYASEAVFKMVSDQIKALQS